MESGVLGKAPLETVESKYTLHEMVTSNHSREVYMTHYRYYAGEIKIMLVF